MERLHGLWTVSFRSNFQTFGTGVAVFTDSRILGGDASYYYDGNIKLQGDLAEANIKIVKFNKAGVSIFGNVDSFNLNVSGNISSSAIEFNGNMIEQPSMKITIVGKKVAGIG